MNRAIKKLLIRLAACAGSLYLALASIGARAQDDKPLRLIVPLASCPAVGTVARILAPSLGLALEQPVIAENVTGGGVVPGTAQRVRAPKYGRTIALGLSNHVINPSIYKGMLYDALKDVTPIVVIGTILGAAG